MHIAIELNVFHNSKSISSKKNYCPAVKDVYQRAVFNQLMTRRFMNLSHRETYDLIDNKD